MWNPFKLFKKTEDNFSEFPKMTMELKNGYFFVKFCWPKNMSSLTKTTLISEMSACLTILQTGQMNAKVKEALEYAGLSTGEPSIATNISQMTYNGIVSFFMNFSDSVIKNFLNKDGVVWSPENVFNVKENEE